MPIPANTMSRTSQASAGDGRGAKTGSSSSAVRSCSYFLEDRFFFLVEPVADALLLRAARGSGVSFRVAVDGAMRNASRARGARCRRAGQLTARSTDAQRVSFRFVQIHILLRLYEYVGG